MNLTFDTRTAAKKMEAVGMERRQAEVISQIIAERQGELVTRSDVADFVTKPEFTETKIDVASLRARVRGVKVLEQQHWEVTLGFIWPLLFIVLVTVVVLVFS